MLELSQKKYELWRSGAEVTAADQFGDKVLHLEDGTYLKLFRIKRLFSSARLFPYWRRFASNANRLAELGVLTFTYGRSMISPILIARRFTMIHCWAKHCARPNAWMLDWLID